MKSTLKPDSYPVQQSFEKQHSNSNPANGYQTTEPDPELGHVADSGTIKSNDDEEQVGPPRTPKRPTVAGYIGSLFLVAIFVSVFRLQLLPWRRLAT